MEFPQWKLETIQWKLEKKKFNFTRIKIIKKNLL